MQQPATAAPVSLTALVVSAADSSFRGVFLPFEIDVGAAAFSRGDDVLVVFDVARPIDLSLVQDDPIGRMSSIQLLSEATILRLPGHLPQDLVLRRFPTGWLIQKGRPDSLARRIVPVMEGSALRLPVESAGRTVIVPDPQTGGNLLIGTIRDGRDALFERRHEGADILEQTIQGVVVDPFSDRLELRPTHNAFLLTGLGREALDVGAVTLEPDGGSGAPGPRILAFGGGTPEALYRRFKRSKASVVNAPAEARLVPRLIAAQDALALGDGPQAETIARVAVADDARGLAGPVSRLILAAAALLDHQAGDFTILDDPAAAPNGEIALWRAFMLAERDPASPEAARLFAATLPLLRSYPAPLQAILRRRATESLVRGGTDAQAAMIDQLPSDDATSLARALLAARRGQHEAALAALDRLASDRDVGLAGIAAEEAVTIREAAHPDTARSLADILEAHLLDARIAGREAAMRLHIADLRARGGQPEKALNMLRETESQFPARRDESRRRVGQILKALSLGPLPLDGAQALNEAVMIQANADMLLPGPDGSRISLFLAARLSALDLPERAAPIVQGLMDKAAPGSDKADLGMRLAELYFAQNDLAGAQTALRLSDPGNLSPAQSVPRQIMMARALAGSGQVAQALASIASLETDEALDLRAALLARSGDWSGSTDALLALAKHVRAASGKGDATWEDFLLKLASAASRSGDETRTGRVGAIGDGQFSDPGKAALFHLLTSGSKLVRGASAGIPADAEGQQSARSELNAQSK